MRFFLGLLILLSIESYAQTEKLDTLTYHQLIEDLFLVDDPFDYPSLSSLVVERKQKRNSAYPRKEKIKLLNGRTVAKYDYEVKDGILISRKLKAQSMTPGSWITANYYYSDSGKVLLTVEYRLFDSDLLGQSNVTDVVKTIEKNKEVSSSGSSYWLGVPPPPKVEVFE